MRPRTAIIVGLVGVVLAATAPAAGAENTFRGKCKLGGTVPAEPQPNGQLVQHGTCTGWLNGGEGPSFAFGNPHSTYRVKVVTEAKGVSGGPLPVMLSGPGRAKFVGKRATIPFRLHQLGLALRILGAGSSAGFGTVVPGPNRSFTSRLEFPTEIRG
jgi:hypothetical protein